MNFLKRILRINRPTTVCFVLMLLTLIPLIGDIVSQERGLKEDGPVVVLEKPHKMLMKFGKDSLYVPLSRADSLKILGLRRYTSQQVFLVQTFDGNRGWVQSDILPIAEVLTSEPNKGDTIRLTGQKYIGSGTYVHGYFAKLPDGTEIETKADNFVPVLDNWQDMVLDDNLMTAIGTEAHFASMTGRTLAQLESEIGPAIQIYRNADGTMLAQFSAKAMGADGKFYNPTYTFASDGRATDVRFDYESDRGDWLLSLLPGSGAILNMPLTGALIRTGVYSWEYDKLNTHGFKLVMFYALAISVMIFGIFWLFFTPSVLVLAMGWLLRFPKVFWPLSDKALRYIMLGVSIICTYWWAVALLGWGMFWPFLLILLFASRYCYRAASRILCGVPHERCPHCRRIHTIKFDHDELYDTEYKTGSEIRQGKLLGTRHSWYQTYDLITTTYKDGHGNTSTSTRKANYKNHKQEHSTYEMIEYDVTYQVDHYHDYWVCDECGFEEILQSTTCNEIDRRRTGSYTDTFTSDV